MFRTLLYYELKKIFCGKLTALALLFGVAVLFLTPTLGFALNEEAAHVAEQEAFLSGRAMDDELFSELGEHVRQNNSETEVGGEDPYRFLASYVDEAIGDWLARVEVPPLTLTELTAEKFYGQRETILSNLYDYYQLSDWEKAWWSEKEAEIEKPFLYQSNRASEEKVCFSRSSWLAKPSRFSRRFFFSSRFSFRTS